MILYMTFSGKDLAHIAVVSSDSVTVRELGVYDFSEEKDAGVPFVQVFTELLQANDIGAETLSGIIVQWGAESRFTVSRLTGVTVNVLAMTHQLPAIVQESGESLESALQRLQQTTTTIVPIAYSADPRIG